MKIIFSRKGFDSSFGGVPSPIINSRPTSVPIPTQARSETTYGDLDLGDIVELITRGRFTAESLCHYDPMFEAGRCAFGQTGAAQSHLANNGVGVGDVFLFFGLFSQADGSDRHHRIFGYLKVEEVTHPGATPNPASNPPGFSRRHPHMIGSWNANNTIYLGSGNTAVSDRQELRLSLPNGPVSHWRIPSWLRDTGLTFHGDPARWGPNCTLHTTSPGQEFVTNITGSSEAENWLCQMVDSINGTTSHVATASHSPVIVVMLRQAQLNNPREMRTDPIWEFGSFGCTGCHVHNLMNPKKIDELAGVRLAFAQGGPYGTRLVHVTPPIETFNHGSFAEAKWSPVDMPLSYRSAPTLIDNDGRSDTPILIDMIDNARSPTPVSRFASKFRSRRKPLPKDVGRQLVETYECFRRGGGIVARCYTDSLPFPPPKIDRDREDTYDVLRASSPFDSRDDQIGSLHKTHQATCRGSQDSCTCRQVSPSKPRC